MQHTLLDRVAVDLGAAGTPQVVEHIATVPPAELGVVTGDARVFYDDVVVQRPPDGYHRLEEIHVTMAFQDQERPARRRDRDLCLGLPFAGLHLAGFLHLGCFFRYPAGRDSYFVGPHSLFRQDVNDRRDLKCQAGLGCQSGDVAGQFFLQHWLLDRQRVAVVRV